MSVAVGLSGPDENPYLDTGQAADLLLTDANQIRRWANAGVIPAHRVPGTRRYWFVREELLRWVRDLRSDASA